MIITKTDIIKNGIWLTFPPLIFSLSLMSLLPNALTPAQFNKGIPDVLVNVESIGRILVFAMPAFFCDRSHRTCSDLSSTEFLMK